MAVMKTSKKLFAHLKARLEFLRVFRKTLYSNLLVEFLYLIFLVGALITGDFVVEWSNSALYAAIILVSLSVVSILVYAVVILGQLSFQREEEFKLLKSRHRDFFEWVKSDVTHLIEKGRPDERLLPGNS